MKKLLLAPMILMAHHACATEYFAASTPSYSPNQHSTSVTYPSTSATPTTPAQTPSTPTPSYSNSQHPYGPPGSPETNYQRKNSTTTPPPRTLPPHPYGPPGRSLLSEAESNSEQTPYYKPEKQDDTAAESAKPAAADAPVTEKTNEPADQKTEKDQYKTEADHALNKKIRDQINGGFEDSYPGIVLITSDGVVVIEGSVPSIDAHDKLEKNVSKVEGVKSVTNNTTVKTH